MAAIPVPLGYGYEHGIQQAWRKHGEVDGASERYQVSIKICKVYTGSCNVMIVFFCVCVCRPQSTVED